MISKFPLGFLYAKQVREKRGKLLKKPVKIVHI